MKYQVKVKDVRIFTFEVEADSEDDAIIRAAAMVVPPEADETRQEQVEIVLPPKVSLVGWLAAAWK